MFFKPPLISIFTILRCPSYFIIISERRASSRADINEAYAVEFEGANPSDAAATKWLKRFEDENFNLEEPAHSRWPLVLGERELNVGYCWRAKNRTTNSCELHKSGFVHKKPRQDPHNLPEEQDARYVEICLYERICSKIHSTGFGSASW